MRRSHAVIVLALLAQWAFAAEPAQNEVLVPLERITVAVPVGLEDWELAWHKTTIGAHVLEWVTGGEKVDDWTQLFTVLRVNVAPDATARGFATQRIESARHTCRSIDAELIDGDAVNAFLEMRASDCAGWDDHHELARLVRTEDYLFQISYQQKDRIVNADARQRWLDVLREVYVVRCCDEDDQGLSAIPLLKLLASYKFNEVPGMRLELVPPKDPKSEDKFVLESSGFPSDHDWDLFIVKANTAEASRYSTLIADERGVLQCPGDDHPAAAANRERGCISKWSLRITQMQKGMPVVFAVRSTDSAHATYAKAMPFPIVGQSGTCRVELELVSSDARTFVAYGSGFPPEQTVKLSWTYARNAGSNAVRSDSEGTFMAAVNHAGEARGLRKWDARLAADSDSCKVDVRYQWGDGGMKLF